MNIFNLAKEGIVSYFKAQLSALKVTIVEGASSLLSNLIFFIICLFIFFCILIFTGMGIAELLSDYGLSRTTSFFVTVGIYFFILLMVIAFKKRITGFFSRTFIKGISAQKEK